jgi:hypothetical protein
VLELEFKQFTFKERLVFILLLLNLPGDRFQVSGVSFLLRTAEYPTAEFRRVVG